MEEKTIIKQIESLCDKIDFSDEAIKNHKKEYEQAIPFEGGMTTREAILQIQINKGNRK